MGRRYLSISLLALDVRELMPKIIGRLVDQSFFMDFRDGIEGRHDRKFNHKEFGGTFTNKVITSRRHNDVLKLFLKMVYLCNVDRSAPYTIAQNVLAHLSWGHGDFGWWRIIHSAAASSRGNRRAGSEGG